MPKIKTKKCKNCGERYEKLLSHPPFRNWCSVNCAFQIQHTARLRATKRREAKFKRDERNKTQADKKAVIEFKKNDRNHQFQLTKSVIQKWVNHVRDAGLPCISCGTIKQTIIYSGGHCKTAGGHSELALDTRNIHRQCLFNCNKNLSGNITGNKHSKGFTVGLIERYGQEYVDWLYSYHESPNYTCEQLIKIRAYYAKLTRDGNKDDSDRPF
jgi:hypothetical protein